MSALRQRAEEPTGDEDACRVRMLPWSCGGWKGTTCRSQARAQDTSTEERWQGLGVCPASHHLLGGLPGTRERTPSPRERRAVAKAKPRWNHEDKPEVKLHARWEETAFSQSMRVITQTESVEDMGRIKCCGGRKTKRNTSPSIGS